MDAIPAGARDFMSVPPTTARCPACKDGDLFALRIAGRAGGALQAVYCAGTYDHHRRRYVRRGCGYAANAPVPIGKTGTA